MRFALALLALSACGAMTGPDPRPNDEDPRVVLAPKYWVIEGQTFHVFTEGLFLDPLGYTGAYDPTDYTWTWTGATMTQDSAVHFHTSWSSAQTVNLSVVATGGPMAGSGSTVVQVVADGMAATKIATVGDSGISTALVPALATALTGETMIGTLDCAGTPCDGVGGQSWPWFATNASSPLTDAGGALDIAAWITALGATPDVIIFSLGANDVFTLRPDQARAAIRASLEYARQIFAAIKAQAPNVIIGVWTLVPANTLQDAWDNNYGPATVPDSLSPTNRFRWQQHRHIVNEEYFTAFTAMANQGIYVVPIHTWVDPTEGFPSNNALHPDSDGVASIVAQLKAFIVALR